MQLSVLEQYRIFHERGMFFKGTALKGYTGVVGDLVKETGAKTLFDYGCGKAILYLEKGIHKDWGLDSLSLYDPGVWGHKIIKHEKPPVGSVFDGVVCTDVLEHVENPEEVIQELIGYAGKFLFCSISCLPSEPKKKLLDGRGFHISIYPPEWWRDKFAKYMNKDIRLELRFDVEEMAKQ